jgi:hypothetical protein
MYRSRPSTQPATARTALAGEISDSARLAALDIHPGRQLVAYLFGSAKCGYCQDPKVKATYANLRQSLHDRHGNEYASISVVGVAVNTDMDEGLTYLRDIGLKRLDEISTGDGWRNEHITNLIRYRKAAEPALPLVIVMERNLSASLTPVLSLHFDPDSIITVVQGRDAIVDWADHGFPLHASATLKRRDGLTKRAN